MILQVILLLISIVILILIINFNKKFVRELKGKEYLINDTLEKVKNIGPITNIVGPVRSGKTLTAVLLVNSKIVILKDKLTEKIELIVSNYYMLDFNVIDNLLDSYYEKGEFNFEKIYYKVFKNIQGTNYDFLNMKSIQKDLKDYIYYYYVLNYRCNYILSNFYIFSRVTLTKSKYLEKENLELKNICKNMNYILDRCLFLVNDEQNIENGNVNSTNSKVKGSGLKELFSLLGNMFEETNEIINIKQVVEDEYVGTRRLETTRLSINSCKEKIYNFMFIQRLIDKWLKFKWFIFTFKYRFIPFRGIRENLIEKAYRKSNNKFRKKEFFWNGVKNFLNSLGLIVIDCDISQGKKIEENIELFFPIKYGYGAYKTHDYACLNDVLKGMSKTSFEQASYNYGFETEEKIKQKSKFLYENLEKENEEVKEVINVW